VKTLNITVPAFFGFTAAILSLALFGSVGIMNSGAKALTNNFTGKLLLLSYR